MDLEARKLEETMGRQLEHKEMERSSLAVTKPYG